MLKRSSELEYLTQCYERSGSQLLVLYGQKHVGKTTLLASLCEKRPHQYYLARACSERQQRCFWGNQLKKLGNQMTLFPSFSEIFRAITEQQSGKKIIIIDEFQFIIKGSESFINELQALLQQETEVLVILCSSQVGFVENSLVTKMGTAAYAIHGFFKVKEMDFRDLMEYFPNFSMKEAIITYAILGGMPGVWQHFKDSVSVKENICIAIEQKEAWLVTEPLRMIEEQLRETNVYYTILSALAEGKHKLNELYEYTGYSRAKISVYLKNLMELEIVEKVFSYDTAGWDNSQKGLYRIKNHLVFFYFRFFYPHLSELQFYPAERYYEEFLEPQLDDYVAKQFPKICRESMEFMNQKEALPFPISSVGEWVGKAGTIPILAKGEKGNYLAGLCNFAKPALSFADYEWFLFCIKQAKLNVNTMYLFSTCGFEEAVVEESKNNKNLILIDMY